MVNLVSARSLWVAKIFAGIETFTTSAIAKGI